MTLVFAVGKTAYLYVVMMIIMTLRCFSGENSQQHVCGDDEQCDLEVFQWGIIMANMCVVMISSITLMCFSGEDGQRVCLDGSADQQGTQLRHALLPASDPRP